MVKGIDKKIVKIACGLDNSAVITEDGSLYMMGDNEYGQLGFIDHIYI